MFYQLPRGNRKGLSREYLLLKYLSDRSLCSIQNRRCLLSWSINPIEYFYKFDERFILCLKTSSKKKFQRTYSSKTYDHTLVTLSEYKERIDDFFYVVPKNDSL